MNRRKSKHKEKLNIAMFGQKRIPSREGGVEIVVEELCTRMVAQGHVNSLYTKLVDICCNSSKVHSFKRTAEEFVCNKYSWNKIVKDTCCLYR